MSVKVSFADLTHTGSLVGACTFPLGTPCVAAYAYEFCHTAVYRLTQTAYIVIQAAEPYPHLYFEGRRDQDWQGHSKAIQRNRTGIMGGQPGY